MSHPGHNNPPLPPDATAVSSDHDTSGDEGQLSPRSIASAAPVVRHTPSLPDTNVRTHGEDNQRRSQSASDPPSSSERPTNRSPSPASGARNRGYSLRRSIFAQNIHKNRTHNDPPIELQRPKSALNEKPRPLQGRGLGTIAEIKGSPPRSQDLRPRRRPLHKRWFDAIGNLPETIDGLFARKALGSSAEGRHVKVNTLNSTPICDERTSKPHIDNTIISCRYTLWNFFPRQLVAQFGKLANFYFLCISILQLIPGLSTTGQFTTIVPLLIFVAVSMAKEGYDDLRRHRLDKEDNESEVDVLVTRGGQTPADSVTPTDYPYQETATTGWQTKKWQDVAVGDVVLLERDEPVPADVILLHADEPTQSAFIETKGLDGETNLKTKKPLKDLSERCSNLDNVARLDVEFVVEDPNLDLYKFDGRVTFDNQTLPLTNSEIIYRGSILRNTPSALGLIIYSGEECKIRMNANKNPRTKAPALQGKVNRVVMFVAALVFFMGIVMTPLYEVWRRSTEINSWYLEDARVILGHVFTSFVIMFNTMLPLSLYVSLEIVKVAQMFQMNDIDMYDPETDTPMEPHTSTINEELGQVSYIFSDKTGTLTNNSMKFRKMSVAGTAWLHDFDLQEEALVGPEQPRLSHRRRGGKGKDRSIAPKGRPSIVARSNTAATQRSVSGRASIPGADWNPSTRKSGSLHCGKTEQLIEYLYQRPNTAYAQKMKFFILALALCHTCIPEKDESGNIEYQAASPDELALVTAAQDLGYIVTDRKSDSVTIKSYPRGMDQDPEYETYEILDVIEFSSMRKRMSILVRLPDKGICLFTKGADTTIQKLLRLEDLVRTSTTNINRRASQRRSLEAQQALRRRSTQAWGDDGARRSQSRSSIPERPLTQRRQSGISLTPGRNARQSVDVWLNDREADVDMSVPRHSNSFYTPRTSANQSSPRASGPTEVKPHLLRGDSVLSNVTVREVENMVDQAIAADDAATYERCFQHIDDFATEGLRTLLYGYRSLSEGEYEEWKDVYAEAATSIVDRQDKMEAAGALIETDLELLGATAIEDKLQKGVPDAIDRFRRAGIKMWMLTGDKRETAINIGHSCRLIKGYSTLVVLDHQDGALQDHINTAVNDISSGRNAHTVLVIDGQTLTAMDDDRSLSEAFTELAVAADSVICCRASPSQKAELVKTIRTRVTGSVTLAIGDGANDIAMIQEAHVGIGIAGKEGLQAARTSDYSIGQFRFLLKLLLVHGRWNYIRICKYTLGTFWKEMIFYLVQAMYQRWNGYTGTSLYESWSLSMFNTLFTSLPVIFMGIFEKDMNPATLLAVPELYGIGRRHEGFNFKLYFYWATLGAIEAVMVYFMIFYTYGEAVIRTDYGVFSLGVLGYSACVTIINLKLQGIVLHNKSITAAIAIFLQVGGWWLWNMILGATYNRYDPIYNVRGSIYTKWGRDLLFWIALIAVVVAILLFEILLKTLWATLKPDDTDIFQALEKDPEVEKRFEQAAADLLQQGWDRGDKKSSQEPAQDVAREEAEQQAREAHVQQLLERPRTMENSTTPTTDGLSEFGTVSKRNSGRTDEEEMLGRAEKSKGEGRSQAEIADLFSKGFGKIKKGGS